MRRLRLLLAVVGVVLAAAGVAWLVIFLAGQGLKRADQWSSVLQLFISPSLALAGLVVAWLAWRSPRPPSVPAMSAPSVNVDAIAGRDAFLAGRDMTITRRPDAGGSDTRS